MTNKVLFLFGTILLVCSVGAPAFAKHDGKHPGPRFGDLIEKLGLDEGTLGKVKGIHRTARDTKLELRFKVEKARNRLKDLLDAETLSESTVMEAAEEIGRLKTKLRKVRLRAMLKIRKLLTPEQRKRFRKFRRKHHGGRHGGERMRGQKAGF